jgi:uncharacterized protein (DUF849 family)
MSELPHQAFAGSKIIVMCAPNGARRGVEDHPAIPLTPASMARNAKSLVDAGVSVLHLHVRDERGRHTLDVDRYRASIEAVRQAVGNRLVVQVTTESAGAYDAEQQMNMVRELRPEAVSLALNELCPPGGEAEAGRFFGWLQREGIWPQYILYSTAELKRFDALRSRGIFSEDHPFCLLVLGSYVRKVDGDVADLEMLLGEIDCGQFPWAVCCFGRGEQGVMLAALGQGGHVRLGFENNLWLPDGRLAVDNAELVCRFVAAAAGDERGLATADQVRDQFF